MHAQARNAIQASVVLPPHACSNTVQL